VEKILVVEDDESLRNIICITLEDCGYKVHGVGNGEEALRSMKDEEYDLILTDLSMPVMDGMALLKRVKEDNLDSDVIVITAYGSIEKAVQAIKLGAAEFITKPVSADEIEVKVKKALAERSLRKRSSRLEEENKVLRDQISKDIIFGIISRSEKMKAVYDALEKVAKTNSSVLICGETGTGKELVARAIHSGSPRRDKPFIPVNCAALAEGVLESELFGHEKGAFTGAVERKLGKFEIAHEGTIFLDEVGEMSQAAQVKLLRVLQERQFERVGGTKTITVDVRIVAATNKDLRKAAQEGKFREDLYYRLNVVPIDLPPLRERKEDIPELADYFIKKYCLEVKKRVTVSPRVIDGLMSYDWPGNVRELENLVERIIVLAEDGQVISDDFISDLPLKTKKKPELGEKNLDEILASVEKGLIEEAMRKAGNSKNVAANILGIKRTTLYTKLSKYGLDL
jgi:DNA-binding NtrC family response regulator